MDQVKFLLYILLLILTVGACEFVMKVTELRNSSISYTVAAIVAVLVIYMAGTWVLIAA